MLASGATAIAGFAALAASDIRMLRDFGIVTVVDLTVSLVGVMIVLPAALLWAEQHGPFALRDLDPAAPAAPAARPAHAGGRAVSDDRFGDLGGRAARAQRRRRLGERLAERDRTASRADAPAGGPAARQQVRLARGHPRRHGAERPPVHHDPAEQRRGAEGAGARLAAEGVRRPLRARGPRGRVERLPAEEGLQQDQRATPRPARCAARAWSTSATCAARPLVLTFVFDRGADCLPQVDRTERVRDDLPGVNFATVFFSHKKRDELRRIVRGPAAGSSRWPWTTAPWRTSTAWAAARPPSSPARAAGARDEARQPHRGRAAPPRQRACAADGARR